MRGGLPQFGSRNEVWVSISVPRQTNTAMTGQDPLDLCKVEPPFGQWLAKAGGSAVGFEGLGFGCEAHLNPPKYAHG